MNVFKLFCFPYAGGASTVFKEWRKYLDPRIELVPVEMAGRGQRIHESLYKDMAGAVEDLFLIIRNNIGNSPYALFGHSMGGKICYNLAQKISAAESMPLPQHIFFSGCGAPHIDRKDKKKFHQMNDADFIREVLSLGGTPPEFFEHPELLDLFLPVLRSDFRMIETLVVNPCVSPLNTDISVLFGREEDLTTEQKAGWKLHTLKTCREYFFDGGHFFIHQETAAIVSIINTTLAKKFTAVYHS